MSVCLAREAFLRQGKIKMLLTAHFQRGTQCTIFLNYSASLLEAEEKYKIQTNVVTFYKGCIRENGMTMCVVELKQCLAACRRRNHVCVFPLPLLESSPYKMQEPQRDVV